MALVAWLTCCGRFGGSAPGAILAGLLCGVKSTAAHPLSKVQSDGKAIWPSSSLARQICSPCLQKASV